MSKSKKSDSVLASPDDMKPYLSSVDVKDLPQLKDWKVGGEYTVELKVRLTSINQYEKSPLSGSFDVLEISAEDPKEDAFDKGFSKSRT